MKKIYAEKFNACKTAEDFRKLSKELGNLANQLMNLSDLAYEMADDIEDAEEEKKG